jgi:hypothetical protein
MKLVNLQPTFTNTPYLTNPIDQQLVEQLRLDHFDKDGYEVPTPLERCFYEAQGVDLNCEIQYHIAPVQEWFKDTEYSESGLVLDHCMLLKRYSIQGAARHQLELAAEDRPILNKLLGIKPKYGIDFSLDYITHDICMEVIHIEQDFDNIEDANTAKERLEHIIETTDWQAGAEELLARKAEWEHLSSDDHSDYKAQFFGWHRAFDNKKVFSA